MSSEQTPTSPPPLESSQEPMDLPSTRSVRAWMIFVITTVVSLGADLWTKAYAFENVASKPVVLTREDVLSAHDLGYLIDQHEPMRVMEHVLEFTLVLNPGAVFGIGAGQRWFFVVFTVLAVILSIVLFLKWTRAHDWVAHCGFGLIIGGGLGNLYDRALFACVRDFIHPLPGVKLPFGIRWPGGGSSANELWPYVSNVADAFLIVGIMMLMYHAWRMPEPNDTTDPTTESNQEH